MIRPLAQQKQLSSADVDDAMSRLDMSRSVLYKLIQRYKQRPQTSSLLPRKRGRGNNVTLLEDEREKLLDDCIREFYLRPERPSLAALVLEVKPTVRTIRTYAELGMNTIMPSTGSCRVDSESDSAAGPSGVFHSA